jgi:6-pyruvoyltetrahydropterin/6-carboxytetrahydropterin synthase
MYEVSVESHFSAAHSLREYGGKCESLHGHNWKVQVRLRSERLNNLGMVVDFQELKGMLKEVLKELDHKLLNDLDYFKETNPTSENIAKYIFDRLNKPQPGLKAEIKGVTVWETENSSATFYKQ